MMEVIGCESTTHLITGSGRILSRSCAPHTIIEALQPEIVRHPVVIFFPGEYSNRMLTVVSYLRLFGTTPKHQDRRTPTTAPTNLAYFDTPILMTCRHNPRALRKPVDRRSMGDQADDERNLKVGARSEYVITAIVKRLSGSFRGLATSTTHGNGVWIFWFFGLRQIAPALKILSLLADSERLAWAENERPG